MFAIFFFQPPLVLFHIASVSKVVLIFWRHESGIRGEILSVFLMKSLVFRKESDVYNTLIDWACLFGVVEKMIRRGVFERCRRETKKKGEGMK